MGSTMIACQGSVFFFSLKDEATKALEYLLLDMFNQAWAADEFLRRMQILEDFLSKIFFCFN